MVQYMMRPYWENEIVDRARSRIASDTVSFKKMQAANHEIAPVFQIVQAQCVCVQQCNIHRERSMDTEGIVLPLSNSRGQQNQFIKIINSH